MKKMSKHEIGVTADAPRRWVRNNELAKYLGVVCMMSDSEARQLCVASNVIAVAVHVRPFARTSSHADADGLPSHIAL